MLQDRSLSQPETPADLDDVHQAGAVCLRRDRKDQIRVLLAGSRRSGRWGLPKGHIEPGENSRSAARREAFEEAGVTGVVSDEVFGTFTYFKDGSRNCYRKCICLRRCLSPHPFLKNPSVRRAGFR
ncbi:NUDIX hydrolase [Rhizobium mongolense]|uniref:8-oxo-dGTP pyrophosphatase MutT (NUDIX family) n=1 Tax=Rhizobium mongolense TaxID=57676 RepID=A0A7W6RSQ1_9HYPH|nr:NUDIX domain-containing protein [Rhizobium mongolense]MBB4277917.1 8-oxo-dGTP pyrophosphatase MutT (NUDIX family) [Rhizobium mongolense]